MDEDIIKKIRQFNRYYTVWLDVMNKDYLGTSFSWPESRALFEIYRNPGINATEICEHLNMDKSYVSRIIAKLEKKGVLTRKLILGSKGIKKLYLTNTGKEEAKQIDQNGDQQISEKLKNMDKKECDKLCEAMILIENILRKYDKK
ncbi:MAG: MarR family transcriptional regulator [Candidatus Gastranaerophilales bacterium]|nr:MarR family transcriptional regulator [Candidatus Gastranaerophilales bacterium]